MPGNFIWYELLTSDLDAAATFYGSVVGWDARDGGMPGMQYRLWSIADAMIGGLMAVPADAAARGMRPTWLGYVQVDDVDASVASLTQAGGAVHMPPAEIAGVGRMAMVADAQGAPFYVMTPAGGGSSTAFAPGIVGHGGWHELHTSDWQAALAFYGAQFGWRKTDALEMGEMGTYLLFNAGGEAIGGMMNSPHMPRPNWIYYFCVDDIHAAHARVQGAGGAILMGPTAVPGGTWVVQARDPQGAMFGLLTPPRA